MNLDHLQICRDWGWNFSTMFVCNESSINGQYAFNLELFPRIPEQFHIVSYFLLLEDISTYMLS